MLYGYLNEISSFDEIDVNVSISYLWLIEIYIYFQSMKKMSGFNAMFFSFIRLALFISTVFEIAGHLLDIFS